MSSRDNKIHKQFSIKYLGYSIDHCEVCMRPIMRINKDGCDGENKILDFFFHKSETASAIIHAMVVIERLIDGKPIDRFESVYEI